MTSTASDPAAPALATPRGSALALALTPHGRLHLEETGQDYDAPTPAIAARVRKACACGGAQGLLHLGAVELGSDLPASLAWGREIGRLFMSRLCALPNLAQVWDSAELPAPQAQLDELAVSVPPFTGVEFVDGGRLAEWWQAMHAAAREQIAAEQGDVAAWLARKHANWTLLGRVCLHLAENRDRPDLPFAFLATYAAHTSGQARLRHLPLAQALKAHAGDRAALLALLEPVHAGARQCAWLKDMVDSGSIFQPLGWTPAEAYRLLRDLPQLESAGLAVRIPDWWSPRHPPRPQVRVEIGSRGAGLGLQALMDFQVGLEFDGMALTDAERDALLAGGSGLVRLRGRWVEMDGEQLKAVLAHWNQVKRAAAGDNLSLLEGMRLLAGASIDGGKAGHEPPATPAWSSVVPGAWLAGVLAGMKGEARRDPGHIAGLQAELRPYQREGVAWLNWLGQLGLGACLADDMGLGKTLQVLAFMLARKQAGDTGPQLLVVPASLIANWQSEMRRFTPDLRAFIAHTSALPARELATLACGRLGGCDVVITSYGTVTRLAWMAEIEWSLVVLDEAQAIKNPGAQQTRAVKALKARKRIALTGTPVENRLGDLWSLFDFICPGLLGSAQAFARFARKLADDGQTGYAPLRKLVQPYILRRQKTDRRVIADLPDKIELKAWCTLTRLQVELYQQALSALQEVLRQQQAGMARRGAVLAFLMRLKQICNHPSQWLGDGMYQPELSGKFARLAELCEGIAARQDKLLVFTQFQEMTAPLADHLAGIFGCRGLVLHGGTPVKARKGLVDAFQRDDGPPYFVLSLKAGGTGLNLTAASHVIHFDRWWNPAVENQATDRAYRIGQHNNVLVHKFICRGTVEEKIDALIESKLDLSQSVVEGGGESALTEMSDAELLRVVALDIDSALADA
ncbi:MAG: DEAD/DEAH box helicase [Rhodocyclaceae bacterium]|nr:DEAD/DEAH box helicase [Rhodocyclaceae bacterium]